MIEEIRRIDHDNQTHAFFLRLQPLSLLSWMAVGKNIQTT